MVARHPTPYSPRSPSTSMTMFAPQTPPLHGTSSSTSTIERTLASSPLTSSPLAPPRSSPLDRLSVFKTSLHGRSRPRQPLRRLSDNIDMGNNQTFDPFRKPREDEPVKMLWRERLEQRCRDRVVEKRRKSQDRKRGLEGAADEEMDDEQADDMDDELIRRAIVADARRIQRNQEIAYARDVGSSIDPDMEDVGALERELFEDGEEADTEPSPPLSALDDDIDPGELYEAYLADISEKEMMDSLPPSSPPKLPSSPPISLSDDDFDMDAFDVDWPSEP
ncbi:hypothetical protein CALVIDRAFT_535302 [Calocera viscosa TUFC12733]|uniref:Uncharacterized protein n=1 Tax=Calocera viscosa (strain TUFC12733) TaxID=1330018 RepID=A0A167PEE9_CALVF|nr:hypothetical protein CALVIDRAFT_535302 [Calocera viscosa TUFC12733]